MDEMPTEVFLWKKMTVWFLSALFLEEQSALHPWMLVDLASVFSLTVVLFLALNFGKTFCPL